MQKINTDKAYLLGLIVGGGHIYKNSLQIVLPYKKWGNLLVNPTRGGEIARDILICLQPIFKNQYGMDISYKVETDWKILSNSVSELLLADLQGLDLPTNGELRRSASLNKVVPLLDSNEHKKRFLTGLVDTVGSLARSHRRFVETFQVVSFEFKGKNFNLVRDVIALLLSIDCPPDQVLWNHPNQHSGLCRYYKSWKKGFKIRVALDDYFLKGGFVFKSKMLSANENLSFQDNVVNTSHGKPIRISGRVALHKDENSDWLPQNIRGGHYIHNLHFYKALGIEVPKSFHLDECIDKFEQYFCPFTCLTKGTLKEIESIIENEECLNRVSYAEAQLNLPHLLSMYDVDSSMLLFGKKKSDGFPISLVLQGIAFILAATLQTKVKGKRVLGKYLDFLAEHEQDCSGIVICRPNRGTCLKIKNSEFACLVGYINNDFNKKLISKIEGSKIFIREPHYSECVEL